MSLAASSRSVYVREQQLGAGAFGRVYKVRDTETNQIYAEKQINCKDNDQLASVLGEMKTLSKLSHPNIMTLHQTKFDQEKMFEATVCLIFEYCANGNLNDRLRQVSSRKLSLKWTRQISSAIAYLHSKNLVHRDLKPENVLLTHSEDIKVGDFGLSREFVAMKTEDETLESYYMRNGCGTLFYMAPEVFSGHYTEKADVFAVGILLYAIQERCFLEISGRNYYGAFVERCSKKVPLGFQMSVDKNELRVPFEKCERRLARIICSALLFEPKKRSSAAVIDEQLNAYRIQ